jgi:hypothetical protein
MISTLLSLRGALALSVATLISHVWRGFLDAMFVLPVDFGDEGLLQLASLIFTLLFAGWAWALWATRQGSRRGLLAAALINALVLVAVPISWLLVYCPADCRAGAGLFNLANTLNLVLGLLAGVALAAQFRSRPQPASNTRG